MPKTREIECGACWLEFTIVCPTEAYDGMEDAPERVTVVREYRCPHCGAEGEIKWELEEKGVANAEDD